MSSRADSSTPLPGAILGKPFMADTARDLGVSPSRLRGADVRHIFHGVVVPANWGEDCLSLARAYASKMHATHYFSHETAAILHGMRLPRRVQFSSKLHITTVGGGRPVRGKGIQGHVGTSATALRGGLRLATPLEAWCQLGTLLSLEELVIAGDGLVSRKNPSATMSEMQSAVESRQGARGCQNLRDALGYVRERTDSARETMLRLLIVRAGMPEPMINAPVRSRAGRVVAHADLAYPEFNLVLEYDGDQHRTDRSQYYIDIDRLERITREGWRVIRINLKHMANPATLAAVIREALVDAGCVLPAQK